MDSRPLALNAEKLKNLMHDFHLLTGIKIVIFDREYNEILAYPESHCLFCAAMHANSTSHRKCMESNEQSFRRCQATASLYVYHCHAGLVEATVPLINNNMLLGYVMFGQVSDIEDKEILSENLRRAFSSYGLSLENAGSAIDSVAYKTDEQIKAAASILEACSLYILLKDMISLQRENFMATLNSYLMEHLSEDLSADCLTETLHISRRKLYENCNEYLGMGIAEYIKKLRLEEAKRLLKDTRLSVMSISYQVGFTDYNYFCRVFKKEVGMSARKYRNAKMTD